MISETITHYRVLHRLGGGGMGEVYEAGDLRLGRHVALKFLPDTVAGDPHALERFEREARAASSLDHPNICTVYEIGEHEGRTFLSMQLLEGHNLREIIGGHPLPLDRIIDIGMQIADALDAAHSQGILHRDIKPSNIFVTTRGQAKLLDFGLAKISTPKFVARGADGNGSTISHDTLSSPGDVIGTLGYMSPEQALGKELDSRSDLFSFGAVLYEMATGVTPFSGTSTAAIFDSILNRQPPGPLRLNPSIPLELDHIIRKAIEKDREVRSQTATEIRADLKRLRRDTSSDKMAIAPAELGRNKGWIWFAGFVFLVLLGVAARWYFNSPPRVTNSTQITYDSQAKMAMATDGSRIYFSKHSKGRLVLAQVSAGGGETAEIPTPFRNAVLADISRDRSQLLVGTLDGSEMEAALWALPLPSGAPRRLGDILATSAGWSADMKQLVYTRGSEVYLANADGTAVHRLISVKGRPHSVRFSPDGGRLRFTVDDPDRMASSLWEATTDGKHLRPLLAGWHNPPAECCGEWTPDGRYYFFIGKTDSSSDVFAMEDKTSIFQSASAHPIQLTAGPLLFYAALPSSDGTKLFAQAKQPRAQLVRYDAKTQMFVPYLSGISATDLAFSRDGQWVAYVTIPDGSLWRSRIDGSERLQLSEPPARTLLPVWSPDGERILYQKFSIGKGWRAQSISRQGGEPEDVLPEGRGGVDFNWSSDGKSLIFSNGPEYGPTNIQILDFRTKQLSTFPDSQGVFSPRCSPDGRYLAALSQDSSMLLLYDFKVQKWSKWITERGNIAFPTWSKDGHYIYFDNFMTDHPTSRRVKLGESTSEELFSLAGLRRFSGIPSGTWGGLAPDNSRLYVQDLSVQEIYSLQLR